MIEDYQLSGLTSSIQQSSTTNITIPPFVSWFDQLLSQPTIMTSLSFSMIEGHSPSLTVTIDHNHHDRPMIIHNHGAFVATCNRWNRLAWLIMVPGTTICGPIQQASWVSTITGTLVTKPGRGTTTSVGPAHHPWPSRHVFLIGALLSERDEI